MMRADELVEESCPVVLLYVVLDFLPALEIAWVVKSSISFWLKLRADLFSRHGSRLSVCVVTVDERGEDVMFDDIYRQCNGKQ